LGGHFWVNVRGRSSQQIGSVPPTRTI
jgi:hypothetical protein